MAFNFQGSAALVEMPFSAGRWRKRLDSADKRWLGPGTAVPELITCKAPEQSAEGQRDAEEAFVIGASACVVFTRER
jgi:hypothetical protein